MVRAMKDFSLARSLSEINIAAGKAVTRVSATLALFAILVSGTAIVYSAWAWKAQRMWAERFEKNDAHRTALLQRIDGLERAGAERERLIRLLLSFERDDRRGQTGSPSTPQGSFPG